MEAQADTWYCRSELAIMFLEALVTAGKGCGYGILVTAAIPEAGIPVD